MPAPQQLTEAPTPGGRVHVDPTDVATRIGAYADTEHRRVVAAVSLWSGSIDDASDAVVDALGRAWERLEKGERIDNLAAWVTRTAMNQLRSTHRHRSVERKHRHLVAVTDDGNDPSHASDARLDLTQALTALTTRQRDIIALHYGLDLSLADIARQLDIAEGTVKATLHQSRAILASKLTAPASGGSHG